PARARMATTEAGAQALERALMRAQGMRLPAVLRHEVHPRQAVHAGGDLDRAAGHREGHRRVRDALLGTVDEELDRGVPGAFGDLPALELGGQEADVDRAVRGPARRRVRVEEELGAGEQLPPAQLRQGAAVAGL